jgi:hypothetical protein
MGSSRPDKFDKALPHNLEAERAVLGAILLDNAYLEPALHVMRPDDLILPQHRNILRTMMDLAHAGTPIDTITLPEALTSKSQLAAAGGQEYLDQLIDGRARVTNVEFYAGIVAKKAALRRLIFSAHAIEQNALEPDADIAALQKQLAAAATPANGNGNGMADYSLLAFLEKEFPAPEHLIEGLIPRHGSAMIVAMPHHLKSWFTLGLALGASVPGTIMGKLIVPKPVRSYYVPVEDHPGEVQWRIRELMKSSTFSDIDPANVCVQPRSYGGLDIMDEAFFQKLVTRIQAFKADHVIIDVLRRVFRGDINSPKESAALCEQFDRLRDLTECALTIVHHENRKEADIMRASAGSFNLPAWANVVIQFKRKIQQTGTSSVEIEVDNKLAKSPEPARMILEVAADVILRLEAIEDGAGIDELREKLGSFWTWRDFAEALEISKATAWRRLKKLLTAGVVEQVRQNKPTAGGMARYAFTQFTSTAE